MAVSRSRCSATTTGSVPASADRTSTWSPAIPLIGRSSSQLPGPPSRVWVARADASTAECDSTTCLGSPVLPDVRTTIGSPPKRTHGSSKACTARVVPVTGRREAVMAELS